MPLNCYTRKKKDGSNYVSCENKKDLKTTEKKNISNTKMPPKKYPKGTSKKFIAGTARKDSPHQYWNNEQIRIGQNIKSQIPEALVGELFGHNVSKTGKAQRTHLIGVRKIPELEGHAKSVNNPELNAHIQEWHKSYAVYRKMMKDRKAGVGAYAPATATAPAKTLYTLARKGPSQSEPTIKPPVSTMKISKPKPKKKVVVKLDPSKIGAFTKLGKPVPKGKIKVYGVKKSTARPAPIQKVSTKAKAPRKSKPVKYAKTIPQKIAKEELKGATKKNIVKPYLARNVRRGAGAVFV